MAFQPVPNVAQCRVEGRQDNQLTINDVYFEISGGGITPTNIQALATAVDVWARTSLASNLSEDWTYVRTIASDLTSATGPIGSASTPTPGGVAEEALPNNVAMCVSFRTAQRGRSGRGRNFVAGIPSPQVVLNTIDPTFISNILTVYLALIGPGAFVAGWEMVVVSRQTLGALRPSGLAIPITDIIAVTNTVRSMRSREVGHGA